MYDVSDDEEQESSSRGSEDCDFHEDDDKDDDYSHCSGSGSKLSHQDTISVFGAFGSTGNHFVRLALDAGYDVRCLLLPGQELKKDFPPDLVRIVGTLEDNHKVRQVLRGATFVVCMLSDAKKKKYRNGCIQTFLKMLYPLMKLEPTIELFLYQATSLASDPCGEIPVLSSVIKQLSFRQSIFLREQDLAIQYIALQHGLVEDKKKENNKPLYEEDKEETKFSFIITRPTFLLRDGRSRKRLVASKSQPGPFPETYVDVAEFSLNALQMRKLYNTSPYIVGNGF